jgi:hypothetical protein
MLLLKKKLCKQQNCGGVDQVTKGMMVMVGVDGFMLRQEITIPVISFDYLPQLFAEKNVRP